MLRINLLPPERRRLRRTPVFALVPLVLGVALTFGSLAAGFWWLVQIWDLDAQIKQAEDTVEALKKFEREHKNLNKEKAKINNEIKSIKAVVSQKTIDWSQILNALVEVSSKNKGVWFDRIEVTEGSQATASYRKYVPGARVSADVALTLQCNMAPIKRTEEGKAYYLGNPEPIMKFREDLKTHPALADAFQFVFPVNPQWSYGTAADSEEGFFLKFNVVLIAESKKKSKGKKK